MLTCCETADGRGHGRLCVVRRRIAAPGSHGGPQHQRRHVGEPVLTLLQHLMKDGAVTIDVNDEIAGPMCVVYQGQPRN